MTLLTKPVTSAEINTIINGSLSNSARVSIEPDKETGEIRLVVGADYRDRCASLFSKTALAELIDELTKVYNLM